MSTKKPDSKPDDLIESKIKGGHIELTERELGGVAGGLKIDGIEGESADVKHKGEIELLAVRRPGR